jgi:hypothetical protein
VPHDVSAEDNSSKIVVMMNLGKDRTSFLMVVINFKTLLVFILGYCLLYDYPGFPSDFSRGRFLNVIFFNAIDDCFQDQLLRRRFSHG